MKKSAAKTRSVAPVNQSATFFELPRLAISNGTIEGMKWLALVLMVIDHVNKYLLHDTVPAMFSAGRLAMPLFAFVLGFNLARPGALAEGVGFRVLKRLALAGLAASVPFWLLGGLAWGWWPLNIMAMLAVTVAVIQLVDDANGSKARLALAVCVFVLGGALVEFWWPGIAIGLAAWRYSKQPSWSALLVMICSLAALYIINRNWWALGVVPVIFAAPHLRLSLPRAQWFFYVFYPLHLAALWLLVKFG